MTYTREEIVEVARKYVGVRFKKMGRSMQGLDCVGLLTLVGRDLGHDIKDIEHYKFDGDSEKLKQQIRMQSLPANRAVLKPGQIVLLKDAFFPFHCGIIGRDGNGLTVVNANTRRRMVVEQSLSDWKDGISEVREFFGVTN
jgi:hypothetical protein